MRLRSTINLSILFLALVSVLVLVRHQERRARDTGPTSARMLRATAAEISDISWSCSNGMVRVVRKGGDWFLERPVRARASAPSVMQLVAALDRTRVRDVITSEQQETRGLDLAAFGLAPPRATVSVSTPRDVQLFHMGYAVPMGEGLYMREDSSTEVLAVTPELTGWCIFDVDALRESSVLRGSAPSVMRVDLQRAGKPFIQLARDEATGWWLRQPVHARADQAAVEGVLQALYGLHASGYEWDPPVTEAGVDLSGVAAKVETCGLSEDEAIVRAAVWGAGEGLGQEVIFGSSAGDATVYAKRRDANSIIRVAAGALTALTADVADYRDRRVLVVEPSSLTRLSFMRGERKVVLLHTAEAGWSVVEPADWQADAQVIAGVLGPAMGMVFAGFIPKTETNAIPEGVEPYVLSVWEGEAENPVAQLQCFIKGATNDAVVRLPSGEMGLVAPHQMAWLGDELLDPLTFRNRRVLALPRDQVLRIVQVEGETRREVVLDENGVWRSGTEATVVRDETVESILFYLSNLRAMRAWRANATPEQLEAWGVSGTGERSLTLVLQGAESIQKTLLFGRDAASGGTFTMVRGQPVVFLLPPLLVDQLNAPVVAAPSGEGE